MSSTELFKLDNPHVGEGLGVRAIELIAGTTADISATFSPDEV
ncbi:MAG: hypothetical protein AAGM36_07775 [Cyanobacteria bacterium J06597_1]